MRHARRWQPSCGLSSPLRSRPLSFLVSSPSFQLALSSLPTFSGYPQFTFTHPPPKSPFPLPPQGHEEAVLRGANHTLTTGRVHAMILEYGHSTSRAIWDSMKARNSATPAAASPQAIPGNSLYRMQAWASARGYATLAIDVDRCSLPSASPPTPDPIPTISHLPLPC